MQTFLPFPDIPLSAKVLDRQRLGKQRVEVLTILRTLSNPDEARGWRNHPATLMWSGCEAGLAYYGVVICREWISRGYKDNCLPRIVALADPDPYDMPTWFGYHDFHVSHQSNLLRKDFDHYSKYFPNVPDNLEYIWPNGVISSRRSPTSISSKL